MEKPNLPDFKLSTSSSCAVCADPLRNVYLGGYFTNNGVNFGLDWGGNDVKTNAGQQDIFVTKLTYEE